MIEKVQQLIDMSLTEPHIKEALKIIINYQHYISVFADYYLP